MVNLHINETTTPAYLQYGFASLAQTVAATTLFADYGIEHKMPEPSYVTMLPQHSSIHMAMQSREALEIWAEVLNVEIITTPSETDINYQTTFMSGRFTFRLYYVLHLNQG